MSNGPAVVVRRQGFPATSNNAPSNISAQSSYAGAGIQGSYGGGAQSSYLLTSSMTNKFNSKPGNNYNRPSTSSYQPNMYRSNRAVQNMSNQLKNTVVITHLYAIYIRSHCLLAYLLSRIII